MDGKWIIALAPVTGLAINTSSQIFGVHILRLRLSYSIIAGMLSGSLATVTILLGVYASHPNFLDLADIFCVGSLTYLALAYGFWTFLNLNITSLRIRVVRALLRAGGIMTVDDVNKQYGPAERLTRRLERLRNGKQIRQEGDRWQLNSPGVLAIARCIETLRLLVMPGPRGRK